MTLGTTLQNIMHDISTVWNKFLGNWFWMRLVFGLIAGLIFLPFVIAPALFGWGNAMIGAGYGFPIFLYGFVYIGFIAMWIYFFFAMVQVTSVYKQQKKAQVSEISVFGGISKKIFFQCVGIVSLIGILYLAMTYFLVGTFDIDSTPDEDVMKTLGIFILCTLGGIACVIRLMFTFFILLDRRNFQKYSLSDAIYKSLDLTRGKYLPILLSFLVALGIFVILDIGISTLFETSILRPLWKLVYIICINGVSIIILTSIYNTLLQENGLIPLSQKDETPAIENPQVEEKSV